MYLCFFTAFFVTLLLSFLLFLFDHSLITFSFLASPTSRLLVSISTYEDRLKSTAKVGRAGVAQNREHIKFYNTDSRPTNRRTATGVG